MRRKVDLIKFYERYDYIMNVISIAPENDKKIAVQIVDLMVKENLTTYNAKNILELCKFILEINSCISPIE